MRVTSDCYIGAWSLRAQWRCRTDNLRAWDCTIPDSKSRELRRDSSSWFGRSRRRKWHCAEARFWRLVNLPKWRIRILMTALIREEASTREQPSAYPQRECGLWWSDWESIWEMEDGRWRKGMAAGLTKSRIAKTEERISSTQVTEGLSWEKKKDRITIHTPFMLNITNEMVMGINFIPAKIQITPTPPRIPRINSICIRFHSVGNMFF